MPNGTALERADSSGKNKADGADQASRPPEQLQAPVAPALLQRKLSRRLSDRQAERAAATTATANEKEKPEPAANAQTEPPAQPAQNGAQDAAAKENEALQAAVTQLGTEGFSALGLGPFGTDAGAGLEAAHNAFHQAVEKLEAAPIRDEARIARFAQRADECARTLQLMKEVLIGQVSDQEKLAATETIAGFSIAVAEGMKVMIAHYRRTCVVAPASPRDEPRLREAVAAEKDNNGSGVKNAFAEAKKRLALLQPPELAKQAEAACDLLSEGYAKSIELEEQSEWRQAIDVLAKTRGNVLSSIDYIQANLDERVARLEKKLGKKVVAYEKRGTKQEGDQQFIEAGVQYERALGYDDGKNKDRTKELAQHAAAAFSHGGDVQRAARWYRKVLTIDPADAAAVKYLAEHGLPKEAPYQQTKAVDGEYTRVDGTHLKEFLALGADKKDEKKGIKDRGVSRETIHSQDLFGLVISYLGAALNGKSDVADTERLVKQTGLDMSQFSMRDLYLEVAANFADPPECAVGLLANVGIKVTQDELPKGKPKLDSFGSMQVKYLDTTEARDTYKLKPGLKRGAEPDNFDTKDLSTNFSGAGWAIYTMSPDGDIYSNSHKVSQFHHSSFLAGGDAAAAGEIKVSGGALQDITNKSGHYQPDAKMLAQAIDRFSKLGQRPTSVTHFGPDGSVQWKPGVDDFIAAAKLPKEQFDERRAAILKKISGK